MEDPQTCAAALLALRTVAEAYGMAQVAEDAGIQRESLYRALSPSGNPTLKTLMAVMKAVGLRISAVPDKAHAKFITTFLNLLPTNRDSDMQTLLFMFLLIACGISHPTRKSANDNVNTHPAGQRNSRQSVFCTDLGNQQTRPSVICTNQRVMTTRLLKPRMNIRQ
jgi:probable addiction module antidote protein